MNQAQYQGWVQLRHGRGVILMTAGSDGYGFFDPFGYGAATSDGLSFSEMPEPSPPPISLWLVSALGVSRRWLHRRQTTCIDQ
jgi:hypothetical protein